MLCGECKSEEAIFFPPGKDLSMCNFGGTCAKCLVRNAAIDAYNRLPFTCKHCNCKFGSKSECRKHKLSKHNVFKKLCLYLKNRKNKQACVE